MFIKFKIMQVDISYREFANLTNVETAKYIYVYIYT